MNNAFVVNPPERVLRQFGAFWLPAALVAVALTVDGLHAWRLAIVLSAAAIAGLCVHRPQRIWPVWTIWMTIAKPIGQIVSLAALAFVFYAVLTPTAWLSRAFRADPLRLRRDAQAPSYWSARHARVDPDQYFREF